MAVAQLDKSFDAPVSEGYGAITIRVVVLEKGMAASAAPRPVDDAPVDATAEEMLPETDNRPISTFLEEPKRGRLVCVFLINGQRQHAWDNQFIMRDLDLKYLRNRMLVIVDCDGLRPEATARLMQGSRHGFLEGTVYSALESRVIATLKNDPDLRRLEEEAEDDISNLQAGDEAVKAALDQLIEAHHEAAPHVGHGHAQAGDVSRQDGVSGSLVQTQEVVIEGESSLGVTGSEPVLLLRPDTATIRLKPNDTRRFLVHARPDNLWRTLESMTLTFDPPVRELQVTRTTQLLGEEVTLKFVEPEDMDDDEYPLETLFRSTATFTGFSEPRVVERRVVVMPSKQQLPKPNPPLKDDPTFIKVTSRQPIRILIGGADVHVKLRWDGRDELLIGNLPQWTFRVSCESPSIEPQTFLTRPVAGRFELLIQSTPGLTSGEQLKFDIEAVGPGKTLSTAFLATVAEPPSPRKVTTKQQGGGQRRPPYDLKIITRNDWSDANLNCFGQQWSGIDAGSFDPPSAKSPLTIFINQDMDMLASYLDSLLAKKLTETTIQQRKNKYITHVAFHLYQMYQNTKHTDAQPGGTIEAPSDLIMRDEIRRVAHTLLKLMEVTQ